MNHAEAVCIRCGVDKGKPQHKCTSCGFDPQSGTPLEMAKSIYLSTARFADRDEQDEYAKKLLEYAQAIRRGENMSYDPSELKRIENVLKVLRAYPNRPPSPCAAGL